MTGSPHSQATPDSPVTSSVSFTTAAVTSATTTTPPIAGVCMCVHCVCVCVCVCVHVCMCNNFVKLLLLLAERAFRSSQEIRGCKRVAIAAIDFGTTFCSLAYTLPNEDTVNFVELSPGQQLRVPTAILLRQKQGAIADGIPDLMIRDFGFDAQYQTTKLLDYERPYHIYFKLVKMLLYNDKVPAS